MTIRVVIADDQAMVREGLGVVLDAQDDIEVVGQVADGRRAVDMVARTHPDVVLMDVRMPVLDGLAATAVVRENHPDTAVIVLTTYDLDEYVYRALRAGASGFLLKDASAQELADAVRTVAEGEALLAPRVTRRLLTRFARMGPAETVPPQRLTMLTPRENEVLVSLAGGLTNAEIAGELFIAEQTVKTHVGRILDKLGLRDRTQAVVFAYEHGVVAPDTGR
ncbi:response regulator transcription factor [Rhodococcus triatomae]|uniref:DNA-binding response regulator, NarL/FixJ family, contains REC and HTH domains n=1 Tax=Rhodococcus triatomae TaxID=300028 RepID=A0A1G8QMZ1_9NOCA|nr:response regulator transcription factor [Rhodococcus triatomae]QNG20620.1 response regulator transcription factor [Rhodococcus triatomae]QNG23462.1 response regulator transcription factor [Rhodococcus triatomae]SDJ06159.1 DNA-binding response regulator, NarL/FixJ family, contains REC and HTH domains [Rhodococcus triatomae]